MLHIGDNKIVSRKNIVAILPQKAPHVGALLFLADGRVLTTPIAAATLRKRLRPPEVSSCAQTR